ncbi:MAG: alpha-amylase family glycosyl hydrolase [Paludibacter sp.]
MKLIKSGFLLLLFVPYYLQAQQEKSSSSTQIVQTSRHSGLQRSANYIDNNTVTLLLYAPRKQFVYVVSELSNWQKQTAYQMTQDGDYFWITLLNLTAGKEYCYYYAIDNQVNVADPYARKVLEKNFDPYISTVAYPNLTPFPTQCTEKIVSVFQTAQPVVDYIWQVPDFTGPRKDRLTVYELLIRDFTNDGTTSAQYSSYLKLAIDKLDYIKSLGVNAVEIMPIIFQDGTPNAAGNVNWGYHTTFFFAPAKSYGTNTDYKRFVDECHKRGLAVILDIQTDHAWGTCPLVRMYANPVGNTSAKPAADNPWFNVVSPNTSYTYGADFNHESKETRLLMKQVLTYWLQEYKLDGYRFDFSKGLTQTPGEGSPYDASRIAILKEYADTIWTCKPNAYVILEHFCTNTEEKELASYGMMLWGKQNSQFTNAITANSSSSGFSAGTASALGWTVNNRMLYMESHDEERVAYTASVKGPAANDLAYRMKRCGLGAAFLFCMPGPRMMWEFGEMGYDYSLLYSSISSSLATGQEGYAKPPRWDYLNVPERQVLYNIYKTILNFRNQYAQVISDGTYTGNVDGWPIRTITINHPDLNFVLMGNFGDTPVLQIVPSGTWYDLFTDNTGASMFYLQPGEFKLYTNKKVTLSLTDIKTPSTNHELIIYPNPAVDMIYIGLPATEQAEIFSLDGRLIRKQMINNGVANISTFQQGAYIIRLTDQENNIFTSRFIKK